MGLQNFSNWGQSMVHKRHSLYNCFKWSLRGSYFFFIEAIPLCDNISFLYVPSYTTIYIKITQLRVTVLMAIKTVTRNCVILM